MGGVAAIVGVVLVFCSHIVNETRKDKTDISMGMVIAGLFLLIIGVFSFSAKETSKDILDGRPMYEKHYIYMDKDTIPVDSTYTLIKRRKR